MSQDSYISSILHGRLISERRSSLTSSDNSQNLANQIDSCRLEHHKSSCTNATAQSECVNSCTLFPLKEETQVPCR